MILDIDPQKIFTWAEYDRIDSPNSEAYAKFKEKIDQDLWLPDPPIIISPMPGNYEGNFTHFLYNGHTRLSISLEYDVPLNKLSVIKDDQIPNQELINYGAFGLEEVLKHAICQTIKPHPKINPFYYFKYDLKDLVKELNKYEQNQDKKHP